MQARQQAGAERVVLPRRHARLAGSVSPRLTGKVSVVLQIEDFFRIISFADHLYSLYMMNWEN